MVLESWWIRSVDVNSLLLKQLSMMVICVSPWKVYRKHFIIPSTPPSTARSISIFLAKSSVNPLLIEVLSLRRNSSKWLANAMTRHRLVLIKWLGVTWNLSSSKTTALSILYPNPIKWCVINLKLSDLLFSLILEANSSKRLLQKDLSLLLWAMILSTPAN